MDRGEASPLREGVGAQPCGLHGVGRFLELVVGVISLAQPFPRSAIILECGVSFGPCRSPLKTVCSRPIYINGSWSAAPLFPFLFFVALSLQRI